ncbi:MAG: TetR/AcrR family transcriptional regulator [Cyclobacteriaceae bacterium]|nr:TetR/AcrR family transcriptional regulator [Cyclobacteriaceae bacterium]
MGVQERKQREKAAMQQLILETANSLFEQKGIDHISIRNIARAIEYSPATIYLYFKDKNEILYYLTDTFIREFEMKLREFNFIKDHFSRLKNISQSWLEYAINNPQKYQMIFTSNGKLQENKLYIYLNESVLECVHANQLQRMPASEAGAIIISFLHGMSVLVINKKFNIQAKSELRDHLGELINRFLNNMKGYAMV